MAQEQDHHEVVNGEYLRNGKRLYENQGDNDRAVAAHLKNEAAKAQPEAPAVQQ